MIGQPSLPLGYILEKIVGNSLIDEICTLRVDAWRTQAAIEPAAEAWRDAYDDWAHHWVIKFGSAIAAAIRLTLHENVTELPNAEVYVPVLPKDIPLPVASYNRLVVSPKHRGKGLSGVLDNICIKSAKEMGAKILLGATGSVEANRHRITTMQQLGFINLGEGAPYVTDLFSAGRPNVLMLHLNR
jgi:GNAT superfamily N-acetyltransferase